MTIMPLCIHGHSELMQFVFFLSRIELTTTGRKGVEEVTLPFMASFFNPVSLRDVLTGCCAHGLYSQVQIWYIWYSLKFLPTPILRGCCITCSACLRFSRIGLWLRDDPKVNDEWIWVAWLSIWFIFYQYCTVAYFPAYFVAYPIFFWISDPLSPSSPSIGRRRTWTLRWPSLTLCRWQHSDVPLNTYCHHGLMFQ